MRHSRWNRTLAAIFAVWLALVMGDTGFAHHHCPMHDGPMPAAASGSGAHAGGHASHRDHDAPASGGHHACTCIGACSASSGTVAVAEAVELPAPVVACIAVATPERDDVRAPSARAPFTLPFANGPPQRVA